MAKKIKSFTVDEGIYNALVETFKKYGVDVSVSLYVDGCLKGLLAYLRGLEKAARDFEIKDRKNLMTYIINQIVNRRGLIVGNYKTGIEMRELYAELLEWQDEKGALEKGYTVFLYKLTQSPLFELSEDKEYLIVKDTGKKIKTYKTSDGLLTVDSDLQGR